MKGIQLVKVSNRKIKYQFELRRNLTIIRGNSGSGKTTLYEMIAEYTRLGEKSGVNIECKKRCVALVDMDWKSQLVRYSDCIVFIDEGAEYLNGPDFARMIRKTDNYYVIFNREKLAELPYSVNEIYEIKTSGKLHTLKAVYSSNRKYRYLDEKIPFEKMKVLVTEDSKAGFQLYEDFFRDKDLECIPAGSKSSIFTRLKEMEGVPVFVVADGAAFGPEIDKIIKLKDNGISRITLCLPESFEWLILNSGLVRADDLSDVLQRTYDYVDGMVYFSWEQFFTAYLKSITRDTHYKYSKGRLGKYYKNPENEKRIISQIID